MAQKVIQVGLVILVLAIVSAGARAQSDCMNVLVSMASCLSYVSGSTTTPSPSCCSALANVVKTNPRCLCTIVNGGGSSFGVNINQTAALALPSACKVVTPPISRCSAVNGPAMSPVGSPESAPPESADRVPGSPSVTGSKTVPSSGTTTNGSTTKINVVRFVANILVFITASYTPAAFNNIY